MSDFPIVFGSGRGLFGVLTAPDAQPRPHGVVVCAPFGHPNICSYRPLRTLAHRLGEHGWPVLRFDWPGTGDSGEPDEGADPLQVWIGAITGAAEELRARASVEDVALVGMGVGATLALAYAERESWLKDIVLLGPYVTGTAYLGEARARDALTGSRIIRADSPAPPRKDGSLELSGFLVSRDEVEALNTLDFETHKMRACEGRRVLVHAAHEDRTVGSLIARLVEAGADVTYRVSPVLRHAWEKAETSSMPPATSSAVRTWLAAAETIAPSRDPVSGIEAVAPAPSAARAVDCDGCHERSVVLDTARGRLVGVLCEPDADEGRGDWVVFLNAGRVRRIGPNRMTAEYARAWAREGLASLRLDLPGIGDSDGEFSDDERSSEYDARWYQQPAFVSSVRAALDLLATEHEARRFALVGLLSGGSWAFQVARVDERVAAVSLVNPWPLEPEGSGTLPHVWDEVRRIAHRVRLRGARVEAPNGTDSRQREVIETAIANLRSRGVLVEIVFSDGDPGIAYFQELLGPDCQGALERCGAIVDVIRGPDGTFQPPWSREVLQQAIERQLAAVGFLDEREVDADVG